MNRGHRWAASVVAVVVALVCVYLWLDGPYAEKVVGPSGGSGFRLIFGIIAAAFIGFAGIKEIRRLLRALRWLGNARLWMIGHLWLGALSLPVVWLHGGFQHGGWLTSGLMWMLYIVFITGIIGAVIQHWVPGEMTLVGGYEVTYEQIPQALKMLDRKAELVVECACGPADGTASDAEWRGARQMWVTQQLDRRAIEPTEAEVMLSAIATAPAEGAGLLRGFYASHVSPFMRGTSYVLASDARSTALFEEHCRAAPPTLQPALQQLRQICDQSRALRRQRRLHRWLHGWLMVHVPVAYALMILTVVHAVYALRYV